MCNNVFGIGNRCVIDRCVIDRCVSLKMCDYFTTHGRNTTEVCRTNVHRNMPETFNCCNRRVETSRGQGVDGVDGVGRTEYTWKMNASAKALSQASTPSAFLDHKVMDLAICVDSPCGPGWAEYRDGGTQTAQRMSSTISYYPPLFKTPWPVKLRRPPRSPQTARPALGYYPQRSTGRLDERVEYTGEESLKYERPGIKRPR